MPFDGGVPNRDRHLVASPNRTGRKAEIARLIDEQALDARRRKVGRTPRVRDTDTVGAAAPAPPRVNRGDAPPDYDAELGIILPGRPDPEPTAMQRERWATLCTELLPTLGASSGYRALMPIAKPPTEELRRAQAAVTTRLVKALPELEALHRKLLPGWREIVENWLEEHARRRIEVRQREAREAEARAGRRVNVFDLPKLESGKELLAILRRNPPELMRGVPDVLTSAMLDELAGNAQRAKGGRTGGWLPATAMLMLDRWLASPNAFAAHLKNRDAAKLKRRESTKKTRRTKRRRN